MNIRFEKYLNKSNEYLKLISDPVTTGLDIFVVIPAFNEREIEHTLESLHLCDLGSLKVEVLLVINDAIDSDENAKIENQINYERFLQYQFTRTEGLVFHVAYASNLPSKKSGVGYARKIGLDEGVSRFAAIGKPDGILLCLDADCTVRSNYFQAVMKGFYLHPKHDAVSIYFEHMDANQSISGFGLAYEIHLRYFMEMQRWLALPFAYQTIGSAMATTALGYVKEGGMVKRKAGEDFYFLHKFIRKQSCFEINDTAVFPSTRVSDRVPFGTGKAIGIAHTTGYIKTYNLLSFIALQKFIEVIPGFYGIKQPAIEILGPNIHPGVLSFLRLQNFESKIIEINKHVNHRDQFQHRFFRWFDAFLLMKYLHFMRDYYYPDLSVHEASKKGVKLIAGNDVKEWSERETLEWYRQRALSNPNNY